MKADNVAGATFGAGSESCAMANGLIMKVGVKAVNANSTANVSFGDNFPGGVLNVQLTVRDDRDIATDGGIWSVDTSSVAVSGFTIRNGLDFNTNYYWTAIGY